MTARYPRPPILDRITRDRHAVIEASAGTGKTYTIENLVTALVIDDGVSLDRLLVVTFTEKAAAELTTRMRAKLQEVADIASGRRTQIPPPAPEAPTWELTPERARCAETALRDFDSATITTIHGFGRQVISELAFDGGLPFEAEPADTRGLFREAFRAVLRETLAVDPDVRPWLEAVLDGGRQVSYVESVLREVRGANARLDVVFDEATATEAWNGLSTLLRAADEAEFLSPLATLVSNGTDRNTFVRRFGHVHRHLVGATHLPDAMTRMDRKVNSNDTLGKVVSLILAKIDEKYSDAFASSPLAPLVGALRRFLIARVPCLGPLVARSLPLVIDRMTALKRERGLIDFDDMLHLVREALDEREDLVHRMRERWSHALIDEFQDTDPTQWAIFRRVFAPDGNDGSTCLTLVGDPKQSIYRFRGADLATYDEAVATLGARGADRVSLDANWRSTAGLVEAVNAIFAPAGEAPIFDGPVAYDDPVAPVHVGTRRLLDPTGEPVSPIAIRILPADRGEMGSPEAGDLWRADIANEVRRLVIETPHSVEEGDGSRPLRFRDVMILTFTNRENRAFIARLREAGIPVALYKNPGLFGAEIADDLLDLLLAIEDPADEARRLRAWAGPFFAVPLADLVATRDLPSTHPLLARLIAWADRAREGRMEALASEIVGASGFARRERAAGADDRVLRNVRQMLDLLLETGRERGDGLAGWIRDLRERQRNATSDAPDETVYEERDLDADAVQVMTVHKSKGLEAPVVFVGGGFGPVLNRRWPVWVGSEEGERIVRVGAKDDLDPAFVARSNGEEMEENQRVLYVALTRARSFLVLPHFAPAPSEPQDATARKWTLKSIDRSYIGPLNRRLAGMLAAGDADEAPELYSVAGVVPPGAPPEIETVPWRLESSALDDTAHRRAAAAARPLAAPRIVTSYSALKRRRAELDAPDAESGLAAPVEAAVDRVLPAGREAGLFLHEMLEHLDYAPLRTRPDLAAWAARPEVERVANTAALRWGFEGPAVARALRLCHATLTSELDLGPDRLAPLAAMEDPVREMEFLLPLPDARLPGFGAAWPAAGADRPRIERGFLTGAIDLVFRHEGRHFIADWKSDLLLDPAPEAVAAHVEEHYALQARLYSLVLAQVLGLSDAADHERRFGGVAYVFLRHRDGDPAAGIWFARPTFDDLGRYERELDEEAPRREEERA